jgi:hypothetical protein
MTPYSNLSGDFGVVAYDVGDDFIKVQFRHSRKVYVYNSAKPGWSHVQQMQRLAAAGRGLSTYISQHVGKNFSKIE